MFKSVMNGRSAFFLVILVTLAQVVTAQGTLDAQTDQFDLTVSMEIPAQFDHPLVNQAMDDIVAACRRHNVTPAFMPPTPESAAHWLGKGFRMLSLGSDIRQP